MNRIRVTRSQIRLDKIVTDLAEKIKINKIKTTLPNNTNTNKVKLKERENVKLENTKLPAGEARGRARGVAEAANKAQYGDSRPRTAETVTRSATNYEEDEQSRGNMESQEDHRARLEEEERLIKELLRKTRLRAITVEREERLRMLRMLAESHGQSSDEDKLSDKEVNKILKEEKERSAKIRQLIFINRKLDLNNENYFDDIEE